MVHRVYHGQQFPRAAAVAGDTGSATLALPVAGATVEVTLSRDQFAARAEPLYRDFIDMLHELRPAGAPVLLLADAAVAELPGLREALAEFAGCELLAMSPGLAARAASLLPPAAAARLPRSRTQTVSPPSFSSRYSKR